MHKWLKAGFIDGAVLHSTTEGTPQGRIISPVLANLTLDGLEGCLEERFPRTTRRGLSAKVHLVRYADDFIITGSSCELLETEVKPLVEGFLRERGLELSAEKTKITHKQDGFDFLGQQVRSFKGKVLTKPSRKSCTTFLAKVREIIEGSEQATAGHLILQLNPIFRGWANYHRHGASKRTFAKMDHEIFEMLWRWAQKRHRRQPRRWIKERYWPVVGRRRWVFQGVVAGKQEGTQRVYLTTLADVAIRRHVKIQGKAIPYDPAWEEYFEERLGKKMALNLEGKGTLRYLWMEQEGNCLICKQKRTLQTGWNIHHRIWRVHGGKDQIENLVLLHPNCHRQVHSQGLKVEKPAFREERL